MKALTIPMSENTPITEEQEAEFNRIEENTEIIMNGLGLGEIDQIKIQNAVVAPYEIDRLISSGLSGKDVCFMLAIRASYGATRGVTINGSEFCEKWGFKEDDFNLAIARLHKKQIITAPVETVVQLELFPVPEDES